MRIALLMIFASFISGCASTYKQDALTVPVAKLERGKSIVVATPINGRYGRTEYLDSGTMTALAVRAAFARFSNIIAISPECHDLKCLKAASADYYAIPEILQWEDRATEWSGIPDKIEIKLSIYDGEGKELATTLLQGKSKWLTFGGDHPQDLLPDLLQNYVNTLY